MKSKQPVFTTDDLVSRLAVPENSGGIGGKLHAPSGVIGKIAPEARADTPVLRQFNGMQAGRRG